MDMRWKQFSKSLHSALCFHLDEVLDPELSSKFKKYQNLHFNPEIKNRFLRDPNKQGRVAVAQVAEEILSQGVSPSDILLSLSHTKKASVAIACMKNEDLLGIGVDLESADRTIDEKVKKRLGTDAEHSLVKSAIALWTIKEACFKAVKNNEKMLLSQFTVTQFDAMTGEGVCEMKQTETPIKIDFLTQEDSGFRISFAQMMKVLLVFITISSTACNSMSKKDCEKVDWHQLGFEDGSARREDDRLEKLQKTCYPLGIVADYDAYEKGREEGLKISGKK